VHIKSDILCVSGEQALLNIFLKSNNFFVDFFILEDHTVAWIDTEGIANVKISGPRNNFFNS